MSVERSSFSISMRVMRWKKDLICSLLAVGFGFARGFVSCGTSVSIIRFPLPLAMTNFFRGSTPIAPPPDSRQRWFLSWRRYERAHLNRRRRRRGALARMWPDENFHRAVEGTATVIGVFDLDLALGLQALEMLAAHQAAGGGARG